MYIPVFIGIVLIALVPFSWSMEAQIASYVLIVIAISTYYARIRKLREAKRVYGSCPYCGYNVWVIPPSANCPRCQSLIVVLDGQLVSKEKLIDDRKSAMSKPD